MTALMPSIRRQLGVVDVGAALKSACMLQPAC